MVSRRSFFKRLAAVAAVVALAPQLCFRTKPLEFRNEWIWVEYRESWWQRLEASITAEVDRAYLAPFIK